MYIKILYTMILLYNFNMFNIWEVKSMYQNLTLGLVLVAVLTLDGWMNIKRLRSLGKI